VGNLNAAAMAEAVGEGLVGLRSALAWHLQANHYPPVPTSMVEPSIAAIDAAVDEDWNRPIELPEGITYKGHPTVPASALIEQHHLWSFVETAFYGDDDE
jgi:hypothetical protein